MTVPIGDASFTLVTASVKVTGLLIAAVPL